MNIPSHGDYIDIHTHGAVDASGKFSVEVLMAHEFRNPEPKPGIAFTAGIHPWFLTEADFEQQLQYVAAMASEGKIVAVGDRKSVV